jgi:hypothetical protein
MKALSLAVPALALAALLAPPLAEAGQRPGSRDSHRRSDSYGRSYSYGGSYRPVHRHGPGCGHYAYRHSRPAPYVYGGGYYGPRYYDGYYYGAPYPAPYGYGYAYVPPPPPPPPRYYRRPRVGVGLFLRF